MLLTIFVPTDGSLQWLLPTLESIKGQDADVEEYEVLVTDNGSNPDAEQKIANVGLSNLRYVKTSSPGFMNIVDGLKLARGVFRKMLNHRSVLINKSVVSSWIDLVKKFQDSRPVMYFSDAVLSNKGDFITCKNTDEFVRNLTYFCSWSAGISFWDTDIERLETMDINDMFPNMSMLLKIREESEYVIVNTKYQSMQDDKGKGGYNVFHTFGVTFLDLLTEQRLLGKVTTETFLKVKSDLYDWLCDLYVSEVLIGSTHTFDLSGIGTSMSVYFSGDEYSKMKKEAKKRLSKQKIKRLIAKIVRFSHS